MHNRSRHIVDLRNVVPGNRVISGQNVSDVKEIQHTREINILSHNPNLVSLNKEVSSVKLVKKRYVGNDSLVGGFFSQIKSALQFSAMTIVIFLFLFGLSNFEAYKEIINYWYQTEVIKAEKQETPLDDLIKPLDQQEVKDIIMDEGKINYINFQVRPSDYRLYIPKINKNLPIIRTSDFNLIAKNWTALEKDIQSDLRKGVVHYPGTALPGQTGNVFLTSHSSWYPNDPLPYGLSSAFALIDKLVVGDSLYIFKDGEMYIYKVKDKYVVKPTNVEVLDQPTDKKEMTLMTCTPVGTTLNRLIVKLELTYPTFENKKEDVGPQPNLYMDGRLQS